MRKKSDTRLRVSLLGVDVDALTVNGAIHAFEALISRRNPAVVCSLNVDIFMKIQRDPDLRRVFDEADLVLVDGTPMMWAARLLGTPLPGRVSGSDFVPAFSAAAAGKGYRVFLLGAAPGVADEAGRFMSAMHPGLMIVGTYSPPLHFDTNPRESAKAVDIVRVAAPDVLFAAFGAPKQEKWLFRYRHALNVPVSMGVGSSLDYLAGRLKRAPMWMQVWGLEWVARLVQEPSRLWRRYLLDDPPFVFYLARELIRRRVMGSWDVHRW